VGIITIERPELLARIESFVDHQGSIGDSGPHRHHHQSRAGANAATTRGDRKDGTERSYSIQIVLDICRRRKATLDAI